MKNNDKNFDEIPSEKPNKKINILRVNEKPKHEYKNIYLCPLNKHDAVNSMEILDDFIIYGTIMGNVYLCRINTNNSNNIIKKNIKQNFSDNNNELKNKEIKNKNIDSSKISCIKLDINSNNKSNSNNESNYNFNKNEIKTNKDKIRDKNFYDSDIMPTTKSIFNKFANSEVNTKRKFLNKIILNQKNSQSEQNIINQNQNISLISKSKNSKLSEDLIPNPEIIQLITNANENIPCLSFDTKDIINISIGDSDIIRFENLSNFNFEDENESYYYTQIKNYQSESEHILNCEGATCLMNKNKFLLLFTPVNDYSSPIHYKKYGYINKTLTTYEIITGEICMYNFIVPFDFDGDRFLYLEYESENIRRICIYYTLENSGPDTFKINKSFGHISFMKFISLDKIILCKKNKICEIRDIYYNFNLIETWEHIGEEIIAMNFYIKTSDKKIENYLTEESYKKNKKKNDIGYVDTNYKKNRNNKNKNKIELNDNIYGYDNKLNLKKLSNGRDKINNSTYRDLIGLNNKNQIKSIESKEKEISIYDKKNYSKGKDFPQELRNKKTMDFLTIKNEYTHIKKSDKIYEIEQKLEQTEKSNDDDIYIITVDKNGNFNQYHNGKIKTIFKLYDIKNIDQKYKEEEFFSLGFPYFVIFNNKYIAISTDHGIFILNNEL